MSALTLGDFCETGSKKMNRKTTYSVWRPKSIPLWRDCFGVHCVEWFCSSKARYNIVQL